MASSQVNQLKWSEVVDWLHKHGIEVDNDAMDELEKIIKRTPMTPKDKSNQPQTLAELDTLIDEFTEDFEALQASNLPSNQKLAQYQSDKDELIKKIVGNDD